MIFILFIVLLYCIIPALLLRLSMYNNLRISYLNNQISFRFSCSHTPSRTSFTQHAIPTEGGINPSKNILSDDNKPANSCLQSADCSVNSESSADHLTSHTFPHCCLHDLNWQITAALLNASRKGPAVQGVFSFQPKSNSI